MGSPAVYSHPLPISEAFYTYPFPRPAAEEFAKPQSPYYGAMWRPTQANQGFYTRVKFVREGNVGASKLGDKQSKCASKNEGSAA